MAQNKPLIRTELQKVHQVFSFVAALHKKIKIKQRQFYH